jgi:hypothetical protein
MIHGSEVPTVSVPGAVEVAFGLAAGLAEVAVLDAEDAGRVVSGEGDDVEHAARPSATAQRQAVRQERPRPALSAVPWAVDRPGDVLVMWSSRGGRSVVELGS